MSDAKTRHEKMVAAAVYLAQHGAKVGWADVRQGKDVNRRWKSDLVTDTALIPQMLAGSRNSLIVPTKQLVIIDCDRFRAYERLLEAGLPPTLTVITPTVRLVNGADGPTYRGRHVYALVPEGYDVTLIPATWSGGETRRSVEGEQSMVLGPWALRSDGEYEVDHDLPRLLAVLPQSVLDFLIAEKRTAGPPPGEKTEDWQWDASEHGSRHDLIRNQIRYWRGTGLPTDQMTAAVESFMAKHGIPVEHDGRVIDADEVRRMIEGAERKYAEDDPADQITITVGGSDGPIEMGFMALKTSSMPAPMTSDALTGSAQLVGLMQHFDPRTDASYEGLIVATLTYLSALLGPKPTIYYGSKAHGTAIYSVLVGPSMIGRKGTTTGLVNGVMQQVTVATKAMKRSPNSGEGLIAAAVAMKGEPMLIEEEEFARLLIAKGREHSTLSMILRQAFDGGPLSSATAQKVVVAEDHHIALHGNVTNEEITLSLTDVDLKNGFANRLLWCSTMRREKHAVTIHDNALDFALRDDIRKALDWAYALPDPFAGGTTHRLTDEARDALMSAGERYREGIGLAPYLGRRLDTIAARLSLIYACLEMTRVVTLDHVLSALAVTDYGHSSARAIFPETTGDQDADLVLRYLRGGDGFLGTRELNELIGRRKRDHQRVTDILSAMGYARPGTRSRRDGKPGRPSQGIELIA